MESRLGPRRTIVHSDGRAHWFARRAVPGELAIIGLGLLSGMLYLVVHLTEASIFGGPPGQGGGGVSKWIDPSNHAQLWALLCVYAAAILALIALYAGVVELCRRASLATRARWLALMVPVIFHVGFLFSSPYFSTDLYSYTAYGYIGTLPGGNPYYQEGGTISGTAFGVQLEALGWTGSALSPYGPVWNGVETAIVEVTPDAASAVLLTKAVVVAATLASAALVFLVLRRVRPELSLPGTAAFLWNPLLIVILAGEGHNDSLLTLLILASLALSVRGLVAGGVLAQVLAVITKYLPIVLLPLQLVFWWRTESNRSHLALGLGLGGLLGTASAVLLNEPVWLGAGTFVGTGFLGGGSGSSANTVSVLGGLAFLARYAAVAVAVLVGAWYVRDARSLLGSCAGVLLVVVLAGPQKFWPWYAVAPIALMVLGPGRAFWWTTLVLVGCSLLASPIEALPLSAESLIRSDLQAAVFHATRVLPLLTFFGLSAAGAVGRPQRTYAVIAEPGSPVAP